MDQKILWRYRDFEEKFGAGPVPVWLLYGLAVLALVNFAVFFFSCLFLGGDALSGHAAGGRYWLGSKGQLTEVSRAVYTYSLWQTRSMFATHGLAMLAFLIAWLLKPRSA